MLSEKRGIHLAHTWHEVFGVAKQMPQKAGLMITYFGLVNGIPLARSGGKTEQDSDYGGSE